MSVENNIHTNILFSKIEFQMLSSSDKQNSYSANKNRPSCQTDENSRRNSQRKSERSLIQQKSKNTQSVYSKSSFKKSSQTEKSIEQWKVKKVKDYDIKSERLPPNADFSKWDIKQNYKSCKENKSNSNKNKRKLKEEIKNKNEI